MIYNFIPTLAFHVHNKIRVRCMLHELTGAQKNSRVKKRQKEIIKAFAMRSYMISIMASNVGSTLLFRRKES